MTPKNFLFTSESVTEGHPDKVCDQISDAILDEFLTKYPQSRVAAETTVTTGMALVCGEITADCYVDIPSTATTALEGALKLKEISYINATGYSAGELKHGPIAMLDETMPVLSILMQGSVYEKLLSNSEEAKARNARMIALTNSNDEKLDELFDFIIRVPEIQELLSPIIAMIPLQLIAYYIAEFLGKDVDQPRNLAKSVTVE